MDSTRISYAEKNCEVYEVDKEKLSFVNKSIADFKLYETLQMEKPPRRNDKLVYFFDPPWGGINYQDKKHMCLFTDFEPYPIREALT